MSNGTGSKKYADIPGIASPIKYSRRCANYYVFCASSIFYPRAFDEFGYDSCVLIHDWERLIGLVKVHPVPASSISAGQIVYLDPYMPHREPPPVELAKHCRFEYQMEWRIYWTEPLPRPPLPLMARFAELGDLSSFCELITL